MRHSLGAINSNLQLASSSSEVSLCENNHLLSLQTWGFLFELPRRSSAVSWINTSALNEIQNVSAFWNVELKMVPHDQVNQCKQQVAWVLFGYGEDKLWLGRVLCWLQSLVGSLLNTLGDVPAVLASVVRTYVLCGYPILRSIRGWIGWGPGQPKLVGDNPAHSRGLEPDEL